MTHFLKDQIKCKSDPSFNQLLIEKVKFGVKNEAKRFYQAKDHYFLFLDGKTQNFLKNKDFLPNTILNEFYELLP